MAKRHLDREDRKQRKFWRLQDHKAVCMICGESRPTMLERHHLAGAKHHDDVVIVCRNCHSELSDLQLDHLPIAISPVAEDLETVGHYLLGLSDQYTMTAETLRSFGVLLLNKSNTGQQKVDEDF